MRMRRLLIAGTLLLCAISAAAQAGTGIFVPQADGWRVHMGDDPAWAAPDYDDSSWHTVRLDPATFPRELMTGRSRWYRKDIHLPNQPGAMQLLVSSIDGSYEVYVDGRLVGDRIQSVFHWKKQVAGIFPLGAAGGAGGDVEIAIRSHLYDQGYFISRPPFVGIGNSPGVTSFKAAADGQVLGRKVVQLGISFLRILSGAILLSLFLLQRGRREYLWLGLFLFLSGLSSFTLTAQSYIPVSWNGFFGDPCEYWFFAAQLEFVYAFVGHKPHLPVRGYQWLLIAAPFVLSPLAWSGTMNPSTYDWAENGVVLPSIVITIAMLIAWARRGNREAAVLIGPMLLADLGSLLVDAQGAISYVDPDFPGFPRLHLGLVTVDFVAAAQILFLLAIGLVIFLRFVGVSREQVKTQSELEAAGAVQQLIIPHAIPSIRGFLIDSVYHPAQQVGGDFFEIIPLPAGGVLAVVGDVSGKGMPAALTVALILGTLRTLAEVTSNPAEILSGLNRRLEGRSTGFTTCLVVSILPDGDATMASAGHLNPYVSSAHQAPRELDASPGLPLGLAADSEYTNVPLVFVPGETITFLSDGVVEARDARGELFGFERARALAAHTAKQIAQFAEAFGQEDDITVVTLTLTGAAVPV